MKTKILYTFILLLVFLLQSCRTDNSRLQAEDKTGDVDKEAVQVLKVFYSAYIIEYSKLPENSDAIDSLKRIYFTEALIKKLETADLDYDPVLNAQDCDEKWIETLEVTPQEGEKDDYKICYSYNIDTKNCIKLSLANNNGTLQIDDIQIE